MGGIVAESLSALSGRRVLVTGHTGFKGSWLALWLHELGAQVTGFALAPEHTNGHFRLTGLEGLIRHVEGDVRDFDALSRCLFNARPEVVFHLAAQALVRRSYLDPRETFATNIMGSANLLEAVRSTPGVRALIYVTSDKCYENKEWVWGYRETDELGGRDPYSASKASAELVFSCYQRAYFAERASFGTASCRAGNVVGGGDRAADRLIPDIVRALESGCPVRLRNPRATRPWQHVLDALRGYLKLAVRLIDEPQGFAGAWNFGPSDVAGCDVDAVAQEMIGEWGSGMIEHVDSGEEPHEATLLHLACDKARQVLGWRTLLGFDEAVHETANWYRRVRDQEPALEVSRDQIARFCAREVSR